MDKNINNFRNIKKIKSKIKSLRAEMKTKYIINFNQMKKLKKPKLLYRKY